MSRSKFAGKPVAPNSPYKYVSCLLEKEEKKTSGKCAVVSLVLGFVAILLGIAVVVIQPNKLYRHTKLTFAEGGESFSLWMKPNIDPIMKLYAYNITNKDAFLAGKEKLRVEQVGPYIYKEIADYLDPEFNHEEGTVTITPTDRMEWIPHLNNRSEDDIFVMPNVVMLLFANQFAGKMWPISYLANEFLQQTNSSPIMEQSLKEILYGTTDNPILKVGHQFASQWIKFDKMGLFDRVCDLTGETETVYTGEKDYKSAGRLATYNNLTYLPMWDSPCNDLTSSSDGKKFGNDLAPGETLYFYRRFLCRTLALVPDGPLTINDQGIPTIPYKFRNDTMDSAASASYFGKNCYCANDNCLPKGLLDTSKCYYGFSTAMSFPHFFEGDPKLWENIDGLSPNKSLHSSHMFINPDAGIITNCSMKLQLNIVMKNVSDMKGVERFSNLVIPITWAEVGFSGLESETAFKIFMALRVFPIVEKVFIVVTLLVGSALILLNIGALQYGHKKATTQAIKIVKTKIIKDDLFAASDNLLEKEKGPLQNV